MKIKHSAAEDLLFESEDDAPVLLRPKHGPWKVLIVDDEADIHLVTELALRGFSFDGRSLTFVHALSAAEAKLLLQDHHDVAVALIDVVMESDDAGLTLVDYIRNELKNRQVRLIIRTGQPGAAPEKDVIENYDIDDYKEKTELTVQKLYTAVRGALKAYRDIKIIEGHRKGLEHILAAMPDMYLAQAQSLTDFFQGILEQVISVCRLGESGIISTVNGFLASVGEKNQIEARVGDFVIGASGFERATKIESICSRLVLEHQSLQGLATNSYLVTLQNHDEIMGYFYLEGSNPYLDCERQLLDLMGQQVSAALRNFCLHRELLNSKQMYEQTLERSLNFIRAQLGNESFAEFRTWAEGTLDVGVREQLDLILAQFESRV